MEFGKVSDDELSGINFSLPPDPPDNARVLSTSDKKKETKFFVGCAKWGRKDWVGKIYPKGTKEGDFLEHYAKFFNCIELNATFYRIPTFKQASGWKSKVGKDFRFSPKFTDKISHVNRLKEVKEITDQFLEGITGFGENLGPVFLMPHPGMGPKTIDTIESFIEYIPKYINLFIELRHPQWYVDPLSFNAVFDMMERHNVGSIITDTSGRRDCAHMRLTKPEAFIRFVGNGLHPTDYTRVDEWLLRIGQWQLKGIEQVYFYMHQHEEIYSPPLAKYVVQQLNNHCHASLTVPVFINENN